MTKENAPVNTNAALAKWAEEHPFTTRSIKVSDLEVDRRVQRAGINLAKVDRMVKKYNPSSLGVLTVSERRSKALIVIDGAHRLEATRRVTENQGELLSFIFSGLELAEEAQMFLDLNNTTTPPIIDQFKVSLLADSPEGEQSRDIARLIGLYGWKVSAAAADGNVNAVGALERIYKLSVAREADPNLLQMVFLVVTRAWGIDRLGGQAPMVEALGRMFAEYGDKLNTDRLIDILKAFKGGPRALLSETQQIASLTRARHPSALAMTLANEYNKGRRSRTLEPWRQK